MYEFKPGDPVITEDGEIGVVEGKLGNSTINLVVKFGNHRKIESPLKLKKVPRN